MHRAKATRRRPVLGVHIRSADGLSQPRSALLEKQLTLLTELGGTYYTVAADDIAEGLVGFAKAHHATQLVLGTSRRSRWVVLGFASTAV